MPAIGVHDDLFERLRLLARAWEVSEGEVISRLLSEFVRGSLRSAGTGANEEVEIEARYEGVQTTATYQPTSGAVLVTSGPLAGRRFRSPSGAATAVISELNPSVQPNRSGWTFWRIRSNGEVLQTLRRR